MLDALARRLGRYAIPQLGLIIALLQGALYVLCMQQASGGGPVIYDQLTLDLDRIRGGEIWRLATFVVLPPMTNPIFLLCGLYFFWLMSSSLEAQWGAFRFNVYLGVGWVVTVATAIALALLAPGMNDAVPQNVWLLGSVFLAFAWLWPDFVILLFLIIPVKVKYLALVTWIVYLWTICVGSWLERGLVAAAIANFVLFFGVDIVRRMRSGHRRMAAKITEIKEADEAFHRCAVCGVTEKIDPAVHYRTCTDCRPAREYCMAHLKGHEHVRAEGASS
jgi:hypothetical protein